MTVPYPAPLDRDRIIAAAQSYEADMVHFLRDLIAIPAESSHEGPVIERIRREMEQVGFDEITIDPMGNLLGRIGSGKKIITMDSHTDTVGVGDPKEWAWDPYKGKVEDGFVYGRGASDQRARQRRSGRKRIYTEPPLRKGNVRSRDIGSSGVTGARADDVICGVPNGGVRFLRHEERDVLESVAKVDTEATADDILAVASDVVSEANARFPAVVVVVGDACVGTVDG